MQTTSFIFVSLCLVVCSSLKLALVVKPEAALHSVPAIFSFREMFLIFMRFIWFPPFTAVPDGRLCPSWNAPLGPTAR